MASKKKQLDPNEMDRVVAEARRDRLQREQGYREQALKMFPWVCGRCGREFEGKRRRELTVHHKDHNHDNNPPDGSNWELLCIYCHDNEHSRYLDQEWYDTSVSGEDQQQSSGIDKPFANLKDLLNKKK
ncbi:MAG: HNH nuclease family protein [Desulfobacterales bacterium]|nr:MAG: HNH nuclease family protein [Desulfobacterales bacterium]